MITQLKSLENIQVKKIANKSIFDALTTKHMGLLFTRPLCMHLGPQK